VFSFTAQQRYRHRYTGQWIGGSVGPTNSLDGVVGRNSDLSAVQHVAPRRSLQLEIIIIIIITPWLQSESELYRLIGRSLPTKLVSTFEDSGCKVVSVTDPYGRILGFLDRSRYFFFQVAPHLNSRVWVDPVPDLLKLIKSASVWNRTRTSGSVAGNPDHQTTEERRSRCGW
jgi:hypothetical protein